MAPMANDIKRADTNCCHKYCISNWLNQQAIRTDFLDILLFIEGVWQSFVSFYEFEAKIYFNFAKTQVWGKYKNTTFLLLKKEILFWFNIFRFN